MAFAKTMMSVQGFLRFIPSSRFHAKEVEYAIDRERLPNHTVSDGIESRPFHGVNSQTAP